MQVASVKVVGIPLESRAGKEMNSRVKPFFFVLLLASFSMSFAQDANYSAGDFRLHINGIALHFDKGENSNEANWGLGLERSLGITESDKPLVDGWEKFWEFDVYEDSYSDIAISGGFGVQRPMIRHLDFGLKVGLVYEKGLKDDAGSSVLPYLVPFVETSFDIPLNLRATLIPPIPAFDIGGLISFQFIVDLP